MSGELTIKGSMYEKPMTSKERKALSALGYTTQNDIKGLSFEQRTKIIKEQIRNPNFVKPSEKEINKLNRRVNEYNENIDNYVLQIQKKFPKINKDILQQAFDSGNPQEFLAKHPVTKHLTYGRQPKLIHAGNRNTNYDIDSDVFKSFKRLNRSNAKLEQYDIKDPTPVKLNRHRKVPITGFEDKNNVTDGTFLKPSTINDPENKEFANDLLLKIRGIR